MGKARVCRCPHCGSLTTIKKGIQSGNQRHYCKDCSSYFTHRRPDVSASNRFIWFRQWVEEGHKIEYISRRSGYSVRTLKNYFHAYLSHYPTWHIRPGEKVNRMIDGTYFSNKICLILYQDNNVKATQLYRLTDDEWTEEIIEDINNLISLGIRIEGVTCDGARSIIKAVRECAPETIVQRCTVHVQPETQLWLTKKPKSDAGRELRAIVGRLNTITDRELWGKWVVELVRWEERHREYLNQKTIPDDDPKRAWSLTKWCENHSYISDELYLICSTISTIPISQNQQTLWSRFSDISKQISGNIEVCRKSILKITSSGIYTSKTTQINTKNKSPKNKPSS